MYSIKNENAFSMTKNIGKIKLINLKMMDLPLSIWI